MLPRFSDPSPPPVRPGLLRFPGSIIQGILARAALAWLRIYLGLTFLLTARPQLQEGYAASLSNLLHQVALTRGPEFYREFIRTTVLPNSELLARLIPWAEVLLGATLLLGLGTRLAAAVAFVLLVNAMVARGEWVWHASNADAALAAICVAIIVGAAGRTFGIDAMLARRWPRSPLW